MWANWPAITAGREELARLAGADPEVLRGQWAAYHHGRMRGLHGGLVGDLAVMLRACGVTLSDDALQGLAERELASWGREVIPFPDVPGDLRALRAAGFQLAIVTNASCEAASVVGHLGLDREVETVVASCDVGVLKPEPALLEMALDRLSVNPDHAALVDDDPLNLRAARELGIRPILMERRPGSRDAAAEFERVTSLAELRRLIESPEPPARL